MNCTLSAAILGALAVVAGAFGAHALKAVLSPEALSSFETGVRYQMWHALALFVLGLSAVNSTAKNRIAWLWLVGTLLFSGSIYGLHLTKLIFGSSWVVLGPITPIGGALLILGWCLLIGAGLKKRI